ncbi:NUDIX hydrolase [Ktedonobacter racemifer]|uniref:8-oxo-dGTP diphosphatase n=1 Tax=Ktedonobacter racemifer DSM 44963 TaxID=485913 RepID=D6TW81_KTERA|nr:NUDIX domain-containing protein [Ktedonobacter racemifer]EFH84464.1 NUDIX hydrolase [Ktedonobacter racemifer DSM 44963]
MNVCVGGILLKENKLLLGKRAAHRTFYPNVWDIVGGHAESNETPEQTLIRELKEELDVTATAIKLLTVLTSQEPVRHEEYTLYIYLVTEWTNTPRNVLPDEHDSLHWFEIHEALQLDLALPIYTEVFTQLGTLENEIVLERVLPGDDKVVGERKRALFPNHHTRHQSR